MTRENKMPKVLLTVIVLALIIGLGYYMANMGENGPVLSIDKEGEGDINPEVGTHAYEEGEEVTVNAVPGEGWEFKNWKGDIEDKDPEINITMDESKNVTAVFGEEEVPAEVTAEELDIELHTLVPGAYNLVITYERAADLLGATEGDLLELNINGEVIELEYHEDREEFYKTNLQGYTDEKIKEAIVNVK